MAIKELKVSSSSEEDQEAFQKVLQELKNEIQTLSFLRHKNIVNFMGVCIKPPDTYAIVTEFIEGGSLYDRLHIRAKKVNFSWRQKLSIMLQISQACLFLHQQGIVHRDLKSHNILLEGCPGQRITPKVCDFGLAKSKDKMEESRAANTQSVGTPLWMAPEVVTNENYGSECDVYSFAIIMYEVLYERLPYSDLPSIKNIQVKVATDAKFRPTIFDPNSVNSSGEGEEAVAESGEAEEERKQSETSTKGGFVELMKQGWQHDPKARPKFEKVTDVLESLLDRVSQSRKSMG